VWVWSIVNLQTSHKHSLLQPLASAVLAQLVLVNFPLSIVAVHTDVSFQEEKSGGELRMLAYQMLLFLWLGQFLALMHIYFMTKGSQASLYR
jgi:hypothetical protein